MVHENINGCCKGEDVMHLNENDRLPGRRKFLRTLIATCPLFYIGGTGRTVQSTGEKHKFLENANLSYAQVFDFAFAGFFLPIIRNLGMERDRGEYIEALKRAAEAAGKQSGQFMAKRSPKISLAAYVEVMKNPDLFWQHVLTAEIVEDEEDVFEIKVSECLWAKTFREAQAGNIGYATICYQDYAMCQGFSPKLRMIRDKTLMQGHDFCNHRWVWEG
jgi:hypothetical protein